MGKCIAYTAGAITFMGIGALVTGLALYFSYPNMRSGSPEGFQDDMARYAKCDLKASNTFTAAGTINLMQNNSESMLYITADITGLSPGLHGFHVHELGDTSNNCKGAGGHYNPDNQSHGGLNDLARHVGDLGNINSVGEGATLAKVEIEDHMATLYGEWSVLGRAIVIHASEDTLDESVDASGGAGARVACCTIYASAMN